MARRAARRRFFPRDDGRPRGGATVPPARKKLARADSVFFDTFSKLRPRPTRPSPRARDWSLRMRVSRSTTRRSGAWTECWRRWASAPRACSWTSHRAAVRRPQPRVPPRAGRAAGFAIRPHEGRPRVRVFKNGRPRRARAHRSASTAKPPTRARPRRSGGRGGGGSRERRVAEHDGIGGARGGGQGQGVPGHAPPRSSRSRRSGST